MIKVFINRVKWDEKKIEGDISTFEGELVVDFITIYGDRDQLIRLIVDLCRKLGDDFRREVVRHYHISKI